jgi:hypothetical protein
LRNVDNQTNALVHAELDYWCTLAPLGGAAGPVEILPFSTDAP